VSFLYLHTCVYIFCTIFTLLPFSPPPPTIHQCQPPTLPPLASGQNLLHPPVLQFCRRKNIKDNKKRHDIFEIKIAIQGGFLCCSHACMYYNPNWFTSTRLFTTP
jgi:hypothetical protein